MSNDNDEWMKRLQDQFDKIVDSKPHKSKMSESEKLRQQEIKNRKAEVKRELDENAQGTTTNELNE
tara:strand:- start:252 stop:449 length:198 start_codon:yes stop_codon:yes gene_type:complete